MSESARSGSAGEYASDVQVGSVGVDEVGRLGSLARCCVDELRDLSRATRSGAEVSDTLKYFSERIPATFVHAGVDLEAKGLFNGTRGRQIAGRFGVIENERQRRCQERSAQTEDTEPSPCPICGRPLPPGEPSSRRRTCSPRCRQRAYRWRNAPPPHPVTQSARGSSQQAAARSDAARVLTVVARGPTVSVCPVTPNLERVPSKHEWRGMPAFRPSHPRQQAAPRPPTRTRSSYGQRGPSTGLAEAARAPVPAGHRRDTPLRDPRRLRPSPSVPPGHQWPMSRRPPMECPGRPRPLPPRRAILPPNPQPAIARTATSPTGSTSLRVHRPVQAQWQSPRARRSRQPSRRPRKLGHNHHGHRPRPGRIHRPCTHPMRQCRTRGPRSTDRPSS